jgi:sugar lactone lactonase YvrE
LYVADAEGCTIRRVAPDGHVTTLAGRPGIKGHEDGPAQSAKLDWPRAVALDAAGMLYIADHGNSVLRAISAAGDVTTLAGRPGTSGSDDGVGSTALFRCPWGMAVDPDGTIFVSDICDNTIRKITPGGVVTTFAGLAGVRGSEDGPGRLARFRDPTGLAVDQTGNVYVADLSNNTIRKISPEGMVSTIAGVPQKKGNLDGPANQALFNAPSALAVDHAGNVYVADRGNNNVRKISLNGMVTTIAGPDENRVPPSYSANMRRPAGIAIAPGGLYVADTENQVLWWIVFPPEPPVLRIVRKERSIQLSYEPTSGDFILEAAESMEPGAVWIPQELPVRPSSHRPALELPITSATRFFRLRSR